MMYAALVFFNEARTDFLVYGPFNEVGEAESACKMLKQSFAGPVDVLWTSIMPTLLAGKKD